jgi:hypothetical protein
MLRQEVGTVAHVTIKNWAGRNWWKVGAITITGWTALFMGVLEPLNANRQMAEQRATGLAAVEWDPVSLWRAPAWHSLLRPKILRVREQRVSLPRPPFLLAMSAQSASAGDSTTDERKITHITSLEIEVKSPAECAEKIRDLATTLGGYLVSSEVSGSDDAPNSAITIRVPAARFDEVRTAIIKLAARIESEKSDATDVTKDYVDREARLRNLRASENQYLAIMRRAASVKDTLEVDNKLGEVRGQIEQQQAEFAALARQVETVLIAVTLHAEADAQVFGIHWRPLYQVKLGARDGLESLADYVSSMTAVLFRLPAVLLWLATIIFATVMGWRIMWWVWQRFFRVPQRANGN